jgi:hypothetical protein
MATHIVVGMHSKSATEKPHLIYFGEDGVSALEAAQRACDSGKYVEGRIKRQVIYTWIPCATIPTPVPIEISMSHGRPPLAEEPGKAALKRVFAPAG